MIYEDVLLELNKILIEKNEEYCKAQKRLYEEIGDVSVFFDKIFMDKLDKAIKEMLDAMNEINQLVSYMNNNGIRTEDLFKAD